MTEQVCIKIMKVSGFCWNLDMHLHPCAKAITSSCLANGFQSPERKGSSALSESMLYGSGAPPFDPVGQMSDMGLVCELDQTLHLNVGLVLPDLDYAALT